jgi:type I restriction enzyme S subunit
LYHFASSDYFIEKVLLFQKGATYPAVSDSVIYEQAILIPPLPEQKSIVTRLDELSAKLRELRELQTGQLADLKKLEKAYLREAFRGELA